MSAFQLDLAPLENLSTYYVTKFVAQIKPSSFETRQEYANAFKRYLENEFRAKMPIDLQLCDDYILKIRGTMYIGTDLIINVNVLPTEKFRVLDYRTNPVATIAWLNATGCSPSSLLN